jgi:hypothetical protein
LLRRPDGVGKRFPGREVFAVRNTPDINDTYIRIASQSPSADTKLGGDIAEGPQLITWNLDMRARHWATRAANPIVAGRRFELSRHRCIPPVATK